MSEDNLAKIRQPREVRVARMQEWNNDPAHQRHAGYATHRRRVNNKRADPIHKASRHELNVIRAVQAQAEAEGYHITQLFHEVTTEIRPLWFTVRLEYTSGGRVRYAYIDTRTRDTKRVKEKTEYCTRNRIPLLYMKKHSRSQMQGIIGMWMLRSRVIFERESER